MKICQGPYFAKYFDFFEDEDTISIVMEYLGGGDLYDYLDKRGFKLGEERVR